MPLYMLNQRTDLIICLDALSAYDLICMIFHILHSLVLNTHSETQRGLVTTPIDSCVLSGVPPEEAIGNRGGWR